MLDSVTPYEPHVLLVQNAARLDSEIIYNRDFDYDYFGFKVLPAQ